MLDINLIRENPGKVKEGARKKQRDPAVVDQVLELDQQRRELLGRVEELRAERNKISVRGKGSVKEKSSNSLKSTDSPESDSEKVPRVGLFSSADFFPSNSRGKEIKAELKKLEPKLKEIEIRLKEALLQIPNLPAADVPEGKDESGNPVRNTWGVIPKFSFDPKDYLELGKNLDLIDVERAAKVSGARFGYLKNEAVLLEFALVNLVFKTLLAEGFVPVVPPVFISDRAMKGMGYLEHGGEDETYHFAKDKLYLVGTSEQAVGPMHTDEVLAATELPKRYVAFSTCFRREAGSYGKDTRGIFRVHQFDKVEMFVYVKPKESDKEHEFLLSLEERLVQALKIPYQVTQMCTGDLGDPAARKYDINCWFPSEQRYRETHSTSTCTDFQARRLNIRYKKEDGSREFVHTLNGTAFAIGRTILAILENYQQKDGSVVVPEVLREYVGKEAIKPH
ncbi:serine--tRNA ligase [Candidatus Parcubacteria bacterium]|nr:serine--tRNA ligase [Candidatus Parcubacteria bacterium]